MFQETLAGIKTGYYFHGMLSVGMSVVTAIIVLSVSVVTAFLCWLDSERYEKGEFKSII